MWYQWNDFLLIQLLHISYSQEEKTERNVISTKRKNKESYEKYKSKGKARNVFGVRLEDVPKFIKSKSEREKRLPEFLAKAIKKININIGTVGIYRVNGDSSEVEKLK